MVCYGGCNSNVDMDKILSQMDEWGAEHCMGTPLTLYIRETYDLKHQIHDPNTPTYI